MEATLKMPPPLQFREDLVERYDRPGPRYTSYPAATEFNHPIDDAEYRSWARQSNEDLIPRPLSLFFHIPFSNMLCFYCECSIGATGECRHSPGYLRDLHLEIELQAQLFDPDREVRQLYWGGGTAGLLSAQQSHDLMSRIDRHFRLDHKGGEYSIAIDPREMPNGGIKHLQGLGFNRIRIRVPDFDPRVEQALDRSNSREQTVAVIEEARKHGIHAIDIDLVYGLPAQTVKGFRTMLDEIIAFQPHRVSIYDYAQLPYPVASRKRTLPGDLPGPALKQAIIRNSIEALNDASYEFIGMDQFVRHDDDLARARRNHSLHRNYQGYSRNARCDSIGLGLSAIGQVGENYSQNASRLERYHELLANRRLPVVRGYRSNRDDLLRRALIEALLCNFRIDIRALEIAWQIDFDAYFADEIRRLEALRRDGLVEIDAREIVVLAPGQLLLRNICMIFDRYRPEANPGDVSDEPVS